MEQITNQAHVSFSHEGSDVTRTNHSNTVTTTLKDKYSVLVEKSTTDTCFRPGDTLTYFIHVTNNGCACLSDICISDTLGGENRLTYIDGSARIFINGTMSEITPTSISPLNFDIVGRLERDEDLIIQYNVSVSEDISTEITEITNEVSVHAHPCECGCRNTSVCVEGTASATITKCDYAEVLITKSTTNDSVCSGEEVDYLITLTNTGTVDATNVIVTDTLPANFNATEIRMENNGNHYKFDPSEYTIDGSNLLTLPNETGTTILVPSIAPGVDNTTRITIHGTM